MIYVDSNVPMYLVGAEHPHKQRVVALVPQLISARDQLVTSAKRSMKCCIATGHSATLTTSALRTTRSMQ